MHEKVYTLVMGYVKYFLSSVLVLVLASFFTCLLLFNLVSDTIYAALLTLLVFTGFLIYFKDSIKEFNLKEMKVVLEKNQDIKKEIEKTTLGLVKLLSKLSVYSSGSWVNRKELNDSIDSILNVISVDNTEKERIMKLPRVMEKMMKDKEPLTKEEQDLVDNVFSLEEK